MNERRVITVKQKLLKISALLCLLATAIPVPTFGQEVEEKQQEMVTIPATIVADDVVTYEAGAERTSLDAARVEALIAPYQNNVANSGAIGFFIACGDLQAAAIVADGVNRGYVNLYDPNDCASVQHMRDSMYYINLCNELRARHGVAALQVDPVLMAISIVQTDASKNVFSHSQLYRVSENLAWGGQIGAEMGSPNGYLSNPFDLWYTEEANRPYNNGHFQNIIRPTFSVTGFAVGTNSSIYTTVFGQTFDYPQSVTGPTYTTTQYAAKLDEFINTNGASAGGRPTTSVPGEQEKPAENGPTLENAVAMLRVYNPNNGEHFFTSDVNERNILVSCGWIDEGIGWYAPTNRQEQPVYRLYNPVAGEHHFTVLATERDSLIRSGWINEEVGWFSDPEKRIPLLRAYNPYSFTGTHNYTVDSAEHSTLVSIGWVDEGVGWYGVAAPKN